MRSRPSGPSFSLSICGRELRALELERLELGVDRLVELLRGAAARRRQRLRGLAIARRRRARFLFQRDEAFGAGVDQRQVALVAAGERGKLVDRRVVFAPGGAQREQALLDAFELARIVVGGAQRLFEMHARLVERGERRVDRLHRRLDQRRRLRARGARAAAWRSRAAAPAIADR